MVELDFHFHFGSYFDKSQFLIAMVIVPPRFMVSA